MGVCKQSIPEILPKPVNKPNDLYCAVCELVLTEIEKLLSQNSTEQQIIDSVEKVCFYMPKPYAGICKSFIDQYAPQIIQLLLNQYPPAEVCKQLGLCKTAIVKSAPTDVYCESCKYILTEMEKYIAKNSTEQHIIHIVENICNFFAIISGKGVRCFY